MIRSYLTIALRVLWKNKAFSAISILGLSVGIAFLLLIAAYSWSELQVNSVIKDNDRVFLVQSKWKEEGMGIDITTLGPLAKTLKQEYPTLVEDYYHWDGIGSIVSKGDKRFRESLQLGDSTFFSMFGLPLRHGNEKSALTGPDDVVITASKANKYFGRTNVVGQTLTIQSFSGGKKDFVITGVLKDVPRNSVTGLTGEANEIFFSDKALRFFSRDAGFESWNNPFIVNYVKLKPGVSPADLAQPVKQVLKKYARADIQQNLKVQFMPLNKYYLQSNKGLAKRMIYTLGFVALFILMMAVINFINISIGNSVSRLKEIGVRKVMGGMRRHLVLQFLSESIVLVGFSLLLALGIYELARPWFSSFLAREILPITAFPAMFAVMCVVAAIIIGILAGLYPALVLSAQPSVDSLKGKLKTVREKIFFRHSLVALQFVTAIIVFISSMVVSRQVAFFFNKNLGYDKEHVITAAIPRDWTTEGVRRMEAKRDEFKRLPQVADATLSFEITDGASGMKNLNVYKAAEDSTKGVVTTSIVCDERYANTYGLPLVAGRFFHAEGGGEDSLRVALTETAVRSMGWQSPDAALQQRIKIQGDPRTYTVHGVVKDFHFESMHQSIQPIIFIPVRTYVAHRYLSFKVKPGSTAATVAALQNKWSQLFPDAPFDYKFMDETLAKMYQSEIQVKKASEAATVLSLIIVLLGVAGIVSMSIAKRTKEVGIRKVLGASVPNIVWLFMKEFSGIMLVANCIAWPLAYLLMKNWLSDYAYRININATPFLIVGSCLLLLVGILITVQTVQKAIANPVKSLRTE
jgi:putative ABC transport system permease protein